MATTKKSTKAKAKTTKAKTTKTAKSVKKTAAKKVASAKTSSKSTALKVTKPSRQPRAFNMQRLLSMHMMATGVFLLLAVAALLLMNDASHQLTLGHVTKDQFAGSGVFAPAVQGVYDVGLKWAVVALMLLSVVAPVLYLTKLKQTYTNYVTKTRMQPFRWMDVAVSGAVMVGVVALLSGVSDLPTLKLLGGIMVLAALCGAVAERQNNSVTKLVRSGFLSQTLAFVLTGLFIASYAVSTVVYGGVRSPWYVYALYAVVVVWMVLATINLSKQLSKSGQWSNFLLAERNYLAATMLAKVAFAVILIVGLAK